METSTEQAEVVILRERLDAAYRRAIVQCGGDARAALSMVAAALEIVALPVSARRTGQPA